MQTAKDFYGTAYTPERSEKLDKAFNFLNMALRAEAEKNDNKVNMAMNAAVKAEAEAFA